MKRAGAVIAFMLVIGGAAGAYAQVGAGSGPTPGAGDATRITSGNREDNSAYNRVAGDRDTKFGNGEEKKSRVKRSAVAATIADIKPGSPVRDTKGAPIATVVSVEGESAMLDTGQSKINVPVVAFGKDDEGLLLGITAAQFSELVTKASSAN